MVIYNGLVYTEAHTFARLDVAFEDGRITAVAPAGALPRENGLDAAGAYVLPGFVDIHSHGCMNADFCDGDGPGIARMLAFYADEGVTSLVPATMSLSEELLATALDAMLPYFDADGHGAVLRGVNMEGPFIDPAKKGAQNPDYIVPADFGMFTRLNARCKNRIRLVDVAPEMPGSDAFIRAAAPVCTVSIAHTSANYDQAAAAFLAGASHVTHLFNAMPPFAHRDPGVVGAACDYAAHVEAICDGFHLHPATVRAVFKMFGATRVCLISDSMRATGMPDGDYSLGGLPVIMKGGKATLADGTIAGSATSQPECARRAVGFGVPLEDVVCAASESPAKAAGLFGEVGSIAAGKRADFLLWDEACATQAVIVGGKRWK